MPAVLSGSTSFYSLAHILRFIATEGKSCTLRVRRGDVEDTVLLDEGRFVIAATTDPSIEVSAIASDLLPPEAAERFGELTAATKGRLTGAAIQKKIVSPDEARTLAERVVRAIVVAALAAPEAEFEVDSETEASGLEPLELSPDALIEEAEERRQLEAKALHDSTVLRTAGEIDLEQVTLSAAELKLLLRIDGRRTVADLIGSGDREKVVDLIERLIAMGIVERQTAPLSPEEPTPAAAQPAPATETPPPPAPAAASEASEDLVPGRTMMELPAGGFTAACLTVHDASNTSFPLFDDLYNLGRDPSNDIAIPDASISGRHARLRRTPSGYEIEDTGSRNGSFVNGEKIEKATLADGDMVRLGKVQMVYSVASATRPPAPTSPGKT
ncbi:MAG: FHA domain-containing protein [Thermoanaerobaculia bacterium]